ncbi:TAXI family TRAP transporter solute-binding subunit [Aromatoleum toluclasticum]|uniref:TAXI family TRAP transporter solute-binding subunit n=1 Tax=Aromatoleum toluclasticum TaxID=92003 RepID=UPI001D180A2D|nr:TAXI family TRAP transporter solute-binding subunit [Aromatoleum toluclasticum]MCC4118569.1 TAXI family TRAP transporter solute-binding subunit [Aromatoleum toluclasticum]
MLRIIICGLALALASLGVSAEQYKMTLSGASPSGLWTMIGMGIDGAVKDSFPGSTITYQTSGGGLANIALIDQGKVELGIAHDVELHIANLGVKPFQKPITSLRAIALLYNWAPMQMVITKAFAEKYGIHSFDDIAVKKPPLRVAFNKRGNITEHVAVEMFKAIGVTVDDIRKWGGDIIYAASDEQGDLMKDKRIDMFANGVFVRTSFIVQAGDAVDLVLLPVSERVINNLSHELHVAPFVVKAGSYPWQPVDVPTVALGAVLTVSSKMDDKVAHDLAGALHKHIERLQGAHNSLKAITPEFLASQKVIPYHPGAEAYYREVGLLQ